MTRRARQFALAALAAMLPALASAQVTLQPTPLPLVTADGETWFHAGEAITWSGDVYHQAGPQVFFDRNQMVRSGSYRGIPLYTDSTLEPYSIVFVPLNGGLMQPYERPRTGDLAGTTGSRTPSFPPAVAAEVPPGQLGMPRQAAAPPTQAPAYDIAPELTVATGTIRMPAAPVGTTGRSAVIVLPTRMETAVRPKGINGIWIDYAGRRWFAKGPVTEFDGSFTRSGSYHGAPVYVRTGDPSMIYIAVQKAPLEETAQTAPPAFVTPYSMAITATRSAAGPHRKSNSKRF